MVIITSDHTRPVPSKVTMPILLRRIRQANPDIDITILLATGFHRPTTKEEMIDKFGKELDHELRFGTTAKTVEETVVDENGNETTITKTVEVPDPNATHSIYSAVFYEGSTGWTKNAELNKVFLVQQQNYANDKLRLNGVLTLNEVYDMLGIQRTSFGQIAGWVYTEDSSIGDNFVDFGIFDTNDVTKCNFVNGFERSIVLDFNCIGNVLDYI